MSGSAPEIYIHDLIYSPQEAYKVDFFSPRQAKWGLEIIHLKSHSNSLALRSMFFPLHTMSLSAKVFMGLPTLIAKGSLRRGLCQSQVFLPSRRARCSQHNLQAVAEVVLCFSECPNTDDGTRSGQFLRYDARWTQRVLLPIALVLTHLQEHAKACLEWRRQGSPWVILYPSRLLQNKSSVGRQPGSLKTHHHCFTGIQLLKETICICQSPCLNPGDRSKAEPKGKKGLAICKPNPSWNSKSSRFCLAIHFKSTKEPKYFIFPFTEALTTNTFQWRNRDEYHSYERPNLGHEQKCIPTTTLST